MRNILVLTLMAACAIAQPVVADTSNNDQQGAGITTGQAEDSGLGLGDAEQQAIGCLAGGSISVLATLAAGPSEIIMLWGGGMLVPSGSAAIALSLLGQVGVAGCAIGAISTPTVMWLVDQWDPLTRKATRLGGQVADVSQRALDALRAALQRGGGTPSIIPAAGGAATTTLEPGGAHHP
jgi:hypothetical protein